MCPDSSTIASFRHVDGVPRLSESERSLYGALPCLLKRRAAGHNGRATDTALVPVGRRAVLLLWSLALFGSLHNCGE